MLSGIYMYIVTIAGVYNNQWLLDHSYNNGPLSIAAVIVA